jgi:3-methyl-2-oxobutanoate hydroxymethyltransferase
MVTVLDVQRYKLEGRRFAMLTAYDYTTARLLDAAGIPVLLVGDSLGMVMLGYPTTLPVTLDDVVHHARAVARGAGNALLVGDLPFGTFQSSPEEAVSNAARLLKEGGMHAVKLEGGAPHVLEAVHRLTSSGIPVMGHLGLTPQSVHQMGGFKVQGRTADQAAAILAAASALEDAGAFSVVLEGIPSDLSESVTRSLRIPTIGIGAGPACDGQVLVIHDLLGLTAGAGADGQKAPKFVKRYANLADEVVRAAQRYRQEVEEGSFPDAEHSYRPTVRPAEELRYGAG